MSEPIEHRIKVRTYEFNFMAAETFKEAEIDHIYGEVVKLLVIVPNWDEDITTRVTMTNGGGREIFTTSELDRNEEYDITLCRNECVSVGRVCKWKIVLSDYPGASGGQLKLITYTAA